MLVCALPFEAGAEPEPGLALKGGFNAATLAHDYRVHRYGVSGGAAGYLRWSLGDRLSLAGQLDLLYTPRGANAVFDGELQGRSRQRYFDVTLAARPEMRLGRVSIYLLLGVGVNRLLSAEKESISGSRDDITNELYRIDVALLGGAGVALHLPRHGLGPFRLGTIFLEARHDHGLLDTDKVNGGFKNRSSSLMAGLSFAIASGSEPSSDRR